MNTLLTAKDCRELADGPIQLTASLPSDRAFWAAVLLLATTDGAGVVQYRLDVDENCLGVEIDGKTYYMMPPPIEFRLPLLSAARRFASGGFCRYLVHRIIGWFKRPHYVGSISLEYPQGDVLWNVYEISHGLRMQRAKQVPNLEPRLS